MKNKIVIAYVALEHALGERKGVWRDAIGDNITDLLAMRSWMSASRYYIKRPAFFIGEARSNTGRGALVLMAKVASMN